MLGVPCLRFTIGNAKQLCELLKVHNVDDCACPAFFKPRMLCPHTGRDIGGNVQHVANLKYRFISRPDGDEGRQVMQFEAEHFGLGR